MWTYIPPCIHVLTPRNIGCENFRIWAFSSFDCAKITRFVCPFGDGQSRRENQQYSRPNVYSVKSLSHKTHYPIGSSPVHTLLLLLLHFFPQLWASSTVDCTSYFIHRLIPFPFSSSFQSLSPFSSFSISDVCGVSLLWQLHHTEHPMESHWILSLTRMLPIILFLSKLTSLSLLLILCVSRYDINFNSQYIITSYIYYDLSHLTRSISFDIARRT